MHSLDVREVVERYLRQLTCKRPRSVELQLQSVLRILGRLDANGLRGADLTDYRATRVEEGVAHKTIDNELGYLRAALRVAHADELIDRIPAFRMKGEKKPRRGFIDRAQMESVCKNLRPVIADLVRFAFYTGWRRLS